MEMINKTSFLALLRIAYNLIPDAQFENSIKLLVTVRLNQSFNNILQKCEYRNRDWL